MSSGFGAKHGFFFHLSFLSTFSNICHNQVEIKIKLPSKVLSETWKKQKIWWSRYAWQ